MSETNKKPEKKLSGKEKWEAKQAAQAQEEQRLKILVIWTRSENILNILRSATSDPFPVEQAAMQAWLDNVRSKGPHPSDQEDFRFRLVANDWLKARFSEEALQFGTPFFTETVLGLHGDQEQKPTVMNEDFFAAMLRGESGIGHRIIYCPTSGFWFWDTRRSAFCPTSDAKMEVLLSNYLQKCAEACKVSLTAKTILKEYKTPVVLKRIVNRAKVILEAHPNFFEGVRGARRYVDGKYVEPQLEPPIKMFIKSAVTKQDGACMTAAEAYAAYCRHCSETGQLKVSIGEFNSKATELLFELFSVGFRHDIPSEGGRQTRGWKHLALSAPPVVQISEAA